MIPRFLFVCFATLVLACNCRAQEGPSVVIKAGSKPADVMAFSDIYHYAQFREGQVTFKDGTGATAPLNYNRLLDELQFVAPNGDTLSLANEQTIRWIVIGTDTFYYTDGFVRQMRGSARAKLAIKQTWRIADNKKQGGYNTTSSLAASSSRAYFTGGNRMTKLSVSEDVVLEPAEYYYFGDPYNRFVLAGKKNLLRLFPKNERQINNFLSDNKIDFRKLADLEKTLLFLEQL